MAFGQGKQSSEGGNTGFKKYVGVASVKVLAINPTMKEWNEITGGNMQKEPEYISTTSEGVQTARIVLLVQPDASSTVGNIAPIIPVTFWFRKMAIVGTQSGKIQVIDKYGRTAWVTEEEYANKSIPQYTNGPANIDADYRKIIVGEEQFVNFLKAHLVIPAVSYRDRNGNIVTNPNPSDCEARLDNIMKIFSGNFSEIKTILNYQKNNRSKMLFGVRTTDDGKEYQDVFMDLFLTNGNYNNTRFATALSSSLASGRQTYAKTYFGETNTDGSLIVTDLRERVISPTEFKENNIETPVMTSTGTALNNEGDDLPF